MKKLIIAHRGASGYAKENTLEAFQKAIELGADMIEFDVRKTGDGKLIIIHDREIAGQKISELTFQEINNLAEKNGYKIPLLEETLQFMKGKIKLDIEMKVTGLEDEIAQMVLKYFSTDEFIFTSFFAESIARIKNKYFGVKTGLLVGSAKAHKMLITYFREFFPYFRARKAKADYLLPNWRLAGIPFYITLARFFSLPVIIFTVNDRIKMKMFLKHKNICGIITNFPDLIDKKEF